MRSAKSYDVNEVVAMVDGRDSTASNLCAHTKQY